MTKTLTAFARETLEELPRAQLQTLCKERGIKANSKTVRSRRSVLKSAAIDRSIEWREKINTSPFLSPSLEADLVHPALALLQPLLCSIEWREERLRETSKSTPLSVFRLLSRLASYTPPLLLCGLSHAPLQLSFALRILCCTWWQCLSFSLVFPSFRLLIDHHSSGV